MNKYKYQSPNFQTCRACNQWFSETWNFFNHCQKVSKGANVLALRKLFETIGGTELGDVSDDRISMRLRLLYTEPFPTCPPDPEVMDDVSTKILDEDEGLINNTTKDEKSHMKKDYESAQSVASASSNNEEDEITIIAEKGPKADAEQPVGGLSTGFQRTTISSTRVLDRRSAPKVYGSDTSYGVPVRKRTLEPRFSCPRTTVQPKPGRELYASELNYRIQSLSHRTVFEPMKCSCKSEMIVISERTRKVDNVSADLLQELKTLLEVCK
uniref:C2H2-type domain-containing protein n=1 Tax=Heterorhabditis bacteriophora TaxID=37862 RepID=A0A1I7XF58_HETBA